MHPSMAGRLDGKAILITGAASGIGRATALAASVAGLVGAGAFAAYDARKHGVVGLTKSCALDYAKQNIRLNAVCPGVIQTPMLDRLSGSAAGVIDALLSVSPIGRLGTAEEVA